MHATEVFALFTAAINHHDVEALTALMTDEHLFVDTMGNEAKGAQTMQAGWRTYFAMCPDYWIRIDHTATTGNVVLAAGAAGGTIQGTPWSTPAAWKAVVCEGQMLEWRVFADLKPVYDIVAKR